MLMYIFLGLLVISRLRGKMNELNPSERIKEPGYEVEMN